MSTEEPEGRTPPIPSWLNQMVTSLRVAGFSVNAAFTAAHAVTPHIEAAEQRGRNAADEVFVEATKQSLVRVAEAIKAAEQRGREAAATEYASRLKADWSRYRGSVLEESWKALRDAPGGPLIDAMRVVNDLMDPQ